MANNTEPEQKSGETRRGFLVKVALGAAALAIVGGPLGMLGRFRTNPDRALTQEFPGEDSIFHPASDPRQDSRRKI